MAVDERSRKIIWMRAFGVSWWRIGDRFGRSERTVQRWYDEAIAAIGRRWPDCV
jgi:transposase